MLNTKCICRLTSPYTRNNEYAVDECRLDKLFYYLYNCSNHIKKIRPFKVVPIRGEV